MKKFISILSVAALLSLMAVPVFADAEASVYLSEDTIEVGDTVTLYTDFSDIVVGANAFQVNVAYDQSAFTVNMDTNESKGYKDGKKTKYLPYCQDKLVDELIDENAGIFSLLGGISYSVGSKITMAAIDMSSHYAILSSDLADYECWDFPVDIVATKAGEYDFSVSIIVGYENGTSYEDEKKVSLTVEGGSAKVEEGQTFESITDQADLDDIAENLDADVAVEDLKFEKTYSNPGQVLKDADASYYMYVAYGNDKVVWSNQTLFDALKVEGLGQLQGQLHIVSNGLPEGATIGFGTKTE